MATSFAMQSLIGSPLTSGIRGGLNQNQMPSKMLKRANFQVKAMAEDDKKEVAADKSVLQTPSVSPPPPPPPRAPKVSTKFEDLLAFSGPAPERINGRLAMIGFVAAIGVEIARGQDLFSQINEGGLSWFVGTSVLLSLASLIPLFQGVRAESKSNGVMTSDAELWNGRFAMLGLVALALTEYVKGGAFV